MEAAAPSATGGRQGARVVIDKWLSGWVGLALLGLAALALRLFELGRNPFWLDELSTYQISLQSPGAIIQYAWHDPWPPLYYLAVKLASGFGLVHAEWAWRMLSVGAGTLAVVGMYWLLGKLVSRAAALLAALLIAVSPTQLYFSQEARAHILVMLVVVASTAVLYSLSCETSEKTKPQRRWWRVAWVALTLLGLYTGYSYTLVWTIQAAYLLWIEKARWPAAGAVALTALGFLPLLAWIRDNLAGQLATAGSSGALTWLLAGRMLLGGDPLRYGENWGQGVLMIVLGGLAILGAVWSMRGPAHRFAGYLVLQTALPMIAFFGLVDGLLHMHIPSFDARQFMVLLPAFYGLVGLGWHGLLRQRPAAMWQGLGAALWLVAILAGAPGLLRYWTLTKSPEGDLARAWQREAQPGDSVVSLHYSLDGALSFYASQGVRVFSKPLAEAQGYAFSDNLSLLVGGPISFPYHLADIRQSGRVWVLARVGYAPDIVIFLEQGCTVSATESYPPFEIIRLEHCAPA